MKRGRGNLEAHHKDGYGWCVERRIDVTNGVTLCEECHINFHKIYGYRDSTEEQYEEWIKSKSDINPLLIETLADVCVPQAFLLTGSDIGGENSKSPY